MYVFSLFMIDSVAGRCFRLLVFALYHSSLLLSIHHLSLVVQLLP